MDDFETVGLGLVLEMRDSGASAIQDALGNIDKLKTSLLDVKALSSTALNFEAKDEATPVMDKVRDGVRSTADQAKALRDGLTIKATDQASAVMDKIRSSEQQTLAEGQKLGTAATVRAKDEASSVLAAVTNEIKTTVAEGQKLSTITVRVKDEASGNIQQVRTSFTNASAAAREHGSIASGALNQVNGAAMALAPSVFGMGAAFTAAFAAKDTLGAAVDWQTTLGQIQANTTLTGDQTKELGNRIMQMAQHTSASMNDLALGFMHVTNLGFSFDDAMKIVDAGMKSAVTTGGNATDTIQTLGRVMKEWNLSGTQAATAMDVLHAAAARGDMVLEQLVESGGRAMSTAANLHVPLEGVATAFSALTDHGFEASQAATQVTGILTHLVSPSKSAEAAIAQLSKATGVDLVGDFGRFKAGSGDLIGTLNDLHKATTGNNAAILEMIPALRGGQGALALTGMGFEDLTKIEEALSDVQQGKLTPTEDAWAQAQGRVSFQLGVLRNNIEIAAVALGDKLLPGIVSMVSGANDGIHAIEAWADSHQRLLDAIGTVAGVIKGVFVGAIESAVSGIALILSGIVALASAIGGKLQPAFDGLGQFMSEHSSQLQAIGAALVALQSPILTVGAATEELSQHWDQLKAALTPLLSQLSGFGDVIKGNVNSALEALKSGLQAAGAEMSKHKELIAQLQGLWTSLQPILQTIASVAGVTLAGALAALSVAVRGVATVIGAVLPTAIQVAIGVLEIIISTIKLVVDAVTGLGRVASDVVHGNWQGAWNDAEATVRNMSGDVIGIFEGLETAVLNVLADLGAKATQAAKNMAGGIISALGDLADKVVGHSIIPDMADAVIAHHKRMGEGSTAAVQRMANDVQRYTQMASDALTMGNLDMATAYQQAADLVSQGATQEARDVVLAAQTIQRSQHDAAISTVSSIHDITTAQRDAASLLHDLEELNGSATIQKHRQVTQAILADDRTQVSSAQTTALGKYNIFKQSNDQLIALEQQLAGTLPGPLQDSLKQQIADLRGFVSDAKSDFTDAYNGWKTATTQMTDDTNAMTEASKKAFQSGAEYARKLAEAAKAAYDKMLQDSVTAYNDQLSAWSTLQQTQQDGLKLLGTSHAATYRQILADANSAYTALLHWEDVLTNATDEATKAMAEKWLAYEKKRLADDQQATQQLISNLQATTSAAASTTSQISKLGSTVVTAAQQGAAAMTNLAMKVGDVGTSAQAAANQLKNMTTNAVAATSSATSNSNTVTSQLSSQIQYLQSLGYDTTLLQSQLGQIQALQSLPSGFNASSITPQSVQQQISAILGNANKFAQGATFSTPQILIDALTGKVSGVMAESGKEAIVPLSGAPGGLGSGAGAQVLVQISTGNIYGPGGEQQLVQIVQDGVYRAISRQAQYR